MIGQSIEMEEMEKKHLRELTMWTIFNTFLELSDSDNRLNNEQQFIRLMSLAFAESLYSREKGKKN